MDGRQTEEIFWDLSAIGPGEAASWADLSNVGRLCSHCQTVDWEPVKMYLIVADGYTLFPKIPLYSTYPTLVQLRTAAHEGCHLCTLILTCLLSGRSESSTETMIGLGGPASFIADDQTLIKVAVEVTMRPVPVRLIIEVDHCPIALSSWLSRSMPVRSEMVNKSGPIHSLSPAEEIARFWLEECCARHERCKGETPLLPKRVVDVLSGFEPFLLNTQCQRGRYAALSYCFGNVPILTTTGKTLQERQVGIPMAILPQTVRDAVVWTRELGIQYLWIDSLCILQDNLSDWEVELSIMADIYRDATVTIAATAAPHAGSGCAPVRNKLQLAPFTPLPGIVIEADFSREQWIFQRGPLEKRGWTFQETQLSRRVLRCGGEELAWQCRTRKYLESDPCQAINLGRRITQKTPRTYFGTRPLDGAQGEDGPIGFNVWYQMVEQFTRRILTYPADRLPAFSGIAHYFAALSSPGETLSPKTTNTECNLTLAQSKAAPPESRPPFRYLCGLWHDDFLRGLIWRCAEPSNPVPYRGPTWSWVSRQSLILYPNYELQTNDFCAQLLEVRVTVPGQNPYGRVSSGKVTILGPAAPIPSGAWGDESETYFKAQFPFVLRWDLEGTPQLGCICFKLHKRWCLILAPEASDHGGIYRRVGLFSTSDELGGLQIRMLSVLDWQDEVVTII